eukprot:Rmarinus@m.3195
MSSKAAALKRRLEELEGEGQSQSSDRPAKKKRQDEGNGEIEPAIPKKKKIFPEKDLINILYGFGDVSKPLPETIAVVEDLAADYIASVTLQATAIAKQRCGLNRVVLTPQDFLCAVRRDTRKYRRAQELLERNENISKARQLSNATYAGDGD